ncbi:MAG: YsnF/AvaK domain-containing protein [Bacillus sp. (in: firmicutes)]|uniref:YsnF/AvaK domain-containing protein n=1 Tax=Bacillus marasmi TaxID=1926279 RepID=UPI0011C9D10E|nr:YsnF/AvaK domain-containing protein [Bacillus marasmi]
MKDETQDVTFQLHKEKLDITKERVETADVKVYKNTYQEVKQILVPVIHEELVVEKKGLTSAYSDVEVTRIPLSEERVEVTLHPTVLNNISVDTQQVEEVIKVSDTLKEEKLHIDTIGDINVEVVDSPTDV